MPVSILIVVDFPAPLGAQETIKTSPFDRQIDRFDGAKVIKVFRQFTSLDSEIHAIKYLPDALNVSEGSHISRRPSTCFRLVYSQASPFVGTRLASRHVRGTFCFRHVSGRLVGWSFNLNYIITWPFVN